MQNFKQLKVWEKAHELTLAIYTATQNFPKEERYSLTDQMRRSSSSIPTNLAEGSGRGSDADFARFIQIAIGSACELQYQLILSKDLKYLPEADYIALDKQLGEVRAMLIALKKKLTAHG